MMAQDAPLHEGVLELHAKGYGFLRSVKKNYVAQGNDPFVPGPLIQQAGLREGHLVAGPLERNRQGQGMRLASVVTVEGGPPQRLARRKFDELTPIDPHAMLTLETEREPLTTRVMDLLAPIGKGQR